MPQDTATAPAIHLHQGDLPADVSFGKIVAIDTETLGLNHQRDRLCLVQLSSGDGTAHLVQLRPGQYNAPNLKKLLTDKNIVKLFHFARFDIAVMKEYLGVDTAPIYCTKIVSRLVRTFSQHHGLKVLCRDLLGVDVDKQQQTTDWGAETLSDAQKDYAAGDVLYLHRIKEVLDGMLAREGRLPLAEACFKFLPARAALDLAGWEEEDIFSH